jgi:drug/metabolite transporter (DMT)-like permease
MTGLGHGYAVSDTSALAAAVVVSVVPLVVVVLALVFRGYTVHLTMFRPGRRRRGRWDRNGNGDA